MSNPDIISILKLVWPLLVLQVAVAAWAIVDIVKRKRTRNLSPAIWIVIIIFGELLGPIAYFLFGRAEELEG